ncbi:hypothetical protein SOVF_134410, partial [Spinacia oleracea]
MKDQPAVQ